MTNPVQTNHSLCYTSISLKADRLKPGTDIGCYTLRSADGWTILRDDTRGVWLCKIAGGYREIPFADVVMCTVGAK